MSYTNQPQYSRRDFLERVARRGLGTGAILASGGLSAVLAQETKSKTKELTELLESNPDVFPRKFEGGLQEYTDPYNSLSKKFRRYTNMKPLPKLPKGQRYGIRLPLSVRFELPNSKRAVLTYTPENSMEPLGIYDNNANFIRDSGIKVMVSRNISPDHERFALDVNEKDIATIGGNQVPVTIVTVFYNPYLLDHPRSDWSGSNRSFMYYRRFFAERVDPRTGRKEEREIPEVVPMDRPIADAKYNEILELMWQEARKKVEAAGKK